MKEKIENAKKLPNAAKLFAVTSYTQFLDQYFSVKKIKPEDWDFFIMVASTFVGLSLLNHINLTEQQKDELRDYISAEGIKIYANWGKACEDCTMFVDRTYDGLSKLDKYKTEKEFLFSDSLGSWLVWNLFAHAPDSPEEQKMVRVLGAFVINAFFSWWK